MSKEPETCLGAAARNLFEMLPDSNFWLNPLSECQKPLPATEIALLMNGRIFETLQKDEIRVVSHCRSCVSVPA